LSFELVGVLVLLESVDSLALCSVATSMCELVHAEQWGISVVDGSEQDLCVRVDVLSSCRKPFWQMWDSEGT
jgi:hypothetical protein